MTQTTCMCTRNKQARRVLYQLCLVCPVVSCRHIKPVYSLNKIMYKPRGSKCGVLVVFSSHDLKLFSSTCSLIHIVWRGPNFACASCTVLKLDRSTGSSLVALAVGTNNSEWPKWHFVTRWSERATEQSLWSSKRAGRIKPTCIIAGKQTDNQPAQAKEQNQTETREKSIHNLRCDVRRPNSHGVWGSWVRPRRGAVLSSLVWRGYWTERLVHPQDR